jgi:hypothetical protein
MGILELAEIFLVCWAYYSLLGRPNLRSGRVLHYWVKFYTAGKLNVYERQHSCDGLSSPLSRDLRQRYTVSGTSYFQKIATFEGETHVDL